MRSRIARFVALVLILAACSPGDEASESTTTTTPTTSEAETTTSTSTTLPSTTTTTTVPAERSIINGLPLTDAELAERRILAVKIDNHPRANPQSGINEADMVIELMVEGITRYLTIWHESDSTYLGPMRSGRPTDPTLLSAFNEPTFAISGAQDWVQGIIVSKDVHLVGEVGPPQTFRISGRSAPHNLFVDTTALREWADQRDYPDDPPSEAIWPFGPLSDYADSAAEVTLDFSGNTIVWTWDETAGTWLRTGYGRETTHVDEDGNEEPLGADVMVALYVEQYTSCPRSGVAGSCVPASETIGSGKAFVFFDGRVAEGTWERGAEEEWFDLYDENGEVMMVPPGRVWVSLVPASGGLQYR